MCQHVHNGDFRGIQKHGISATDVKKLKEAGYCTVGAILMATEKVFCDSNAVLVYQTCLPNPAHVQDLCSVKGLSEAKVEKIYESAARCQVCAA